MAVVIPLNNFLGPAGDTVTAQKCSTKHLVLNTICLVVGSCTSHPGVLGFDSQTRGTRENRRTLC